MLASVHRVARVVGARILVIAIRCLPIRAGPTDAVLRAVAQVAVVAHIVVVVFVDAANVRAAGIVGARILIIAHQVGRGHALAIYATLRAVARVRVLAVVGVVIVILAAVDRIAGVVGAGIVVVAGQRLARHALTLLTGLEAIADVAVLT